ncbi:Uncharacterised protein [Actinobaculum suis]|uniref:Bacterial SCP orthologue domain-containing protein n=1 Tax=Actinobaculum suis TaxID=1657 RepID=A0A7Z8Y7S3_9ACTO|nr:sterol carrier family protein [Actinobaculum suis]VDG75434.1 Uncharacterised protein [Actinobaculum suis]
MASQRAHKPRKIDAATGTAILRQAAAGEELTASARRTAVRFALEEIAALHPGKSVEIRVPYAGAVQAIAGPAHRRGTPPNVVEIDADTFIALAIGTQNWEEAKAAGKIDASGIRADLSPYLPLFRL